MTEPETPETNRGPARASVALVVFTMAVLAALVWAITPSRPNFKPAPLDPQLPICPKLPIRFTPTNFTDLPDAAWKSLSRDRKSVALLRLNFDQCACGCRLSVVLCRATYPDCKTSRATLEEIVRKVEEMKGAAKK